MFGSASYSAILRLPLLCRDCSGGPLDRDIECILYFLLPGYSRLVFDCEPYVPRNLLKSGLRVGRVPAMMPVLHSVLLLVSMGFARWPSDACSIDNLHDPYREVRIIPEEVAGSAVVGKD